MNVLAVDTSSRSGAVGIANGDQVLAELALKSQENHSARLLPSIDWALNRLQMKLEDIDVFGVVTGPGSFTGLRVGLATIKGFAWSLKKPVVGLSSLEVLARGLEVPGATIVPMLDARREKVYSAAYQFTSSGWTTLFPEKDIALSKLCTDLTGNIICLGNGARHYQGEIQNHLKDRVHFPSHTFDTPRGSVLAQLTHEKAQREEFLDVSSAEPNYLRQSEAEVKLKERN